MQNLLDVWLVKSDSQVRKLKKNVKNAGNCGGFCAMGTRMSLCCALMIYPPYFYHFSFLFKVKINCFHGLGLATGRYLRS